MNIALLPTNPCYFNDEIFNINNQTLNRDNCCEPYFELQNSVQKSGHHLHTFDKYASNDIDVLIFFNIHTNLSRVFKILYKNPSVRLVYMMEEPHVVVPLHTRNFSLFLPADRIITWRDDLVKESPRYSLYRFPGLVSPRSVDFSVDFAQRKALTMIAAYKSSNLPGELYSARMDAIRHFASSSVPIDLFGHNWDQCKDPQITQSWRGKIQNKHDTLVNYRFSICYENCENVYGYVTEKIFDSIKAGCIPIYRGALNIETLIPYKCFIHVKHDTPLHVIESMIKSITPDEFKSYQLNMSEFINSRHADLFTPGFYSKTILDIALDPIQNPTPSIWKIRMNFFQMLLSNPIRVWQSMSRLKRFIFDLLNPKR